VKLCWRSDVSVVLVGSSAVFARVRTGPFGGEVRDLGLVEDVLSAGAEEIRRAAGLDDGGGGSGGKLVVTLAGAWCSARPIGLGASGFDSARGELVRASEELFPYGSGDVLLGYLGRGDEGGGGRGGWVLGAPRSRVMPLVDALSGATGLGVRAVLSSSQAMLGLGVGRGRGGVGGGGGEGGRGFVFERTALGGVVRHELREGVVWVLGEAGAVDGGVGSDGELPLSLPGDEASARRLAGAAPVALDSGRSWIRPLSGRGMREAGRFAVPAALVLCAFVLMAFSFWVSDWRHERGAERLERAAAEASAEASAARAELAELERLSGLLESARGLGMGEGSGGGRSMLETLSSVWSVLPERGFFDRVRVGPMTVTVAGAASSSQSVLRGLESSSAFAGARQNASVGRFGMGEGEVAEWETFDLTARRLGVGVGSGPAGGER